ncbi:MAG TPA: hypothetical protein VLA28_03305 [Afifellaceae bacterium]|nr:hypothetical protein [Afifellaceae bacterium]
MRRSFGLTTTAAKIAAIAVIMALALAMSAAHADLTRMDAATITAALNGKTISGERGGKTWVQTFDAAGVTVYTAAGEAASEGRWRVREDRFCSQWPPSPAWACYDMFADDDVIVFVGEGGEQWPARITGGN